jgi:ketosteroid isomerase-like protein
MRNTIHAAVIALLAVVTPVCALVYAAEERGLMTEPSGDVTKGIDAAGTAFAGAYMKHDAKALSALYLPGAVWAGTLHPYWLEGRDSIQRLWTFYFATYKNASITFWSSSLRVLVPNAAVAQHATATMAMPDASGRIHNIHMRLSIIWVRVPQFVVGDQSLEWQIAQMHGSEAPLFR